MLPTHEYGEGFTERSLRDRTLTEQDIADAKRRRLRLPEDRFVMQHGTRTFFVETEYTKSFRDLQWHWSWDVSEAVPRGSRTFSHGGFESKATTRGEAIAEAARYIADTIIGDPQSGSETEGI
jgi:hypothetical protein